MSMTGATIPALADDHRRYRERDAGPVSNGVLQSPGCLTLCLDVSRRFDACF